MSAQTAKSKRAAKAGGRKSVAEARKSPANAQTKKMQLIGLLSAKGGADVPAISEKLGWLPHTTRAAISGLRKSGLDVIVEKPGESQPTRYRIIASPADAA